VRGGGRGGGGSSGCRARQRVVDRGDRCLGGVGRRRFRRTGDGGQFDVGLGRGLDLRRRHLLDDRGRLRRAVLPRRGRGRFVLGLGFGLGIREQRRRALATLAGRGPDRGQGRLELRAGRGEQGRVGGRDALDPGQRLLLAVEELDLELHEALDDPAPGDRVDLVEAELHDRLVGLELPLAAELADRDELDERRVAAQLEDQRASVGVGPVARAGGPVGGTLELLAAVRRARAVAVPARDGLDRDRRALRTLPQPGGKSRAGQRAVGRVEVAILELGRADGADRVEARELLGEQVAVPGGLVPEPVLELDFDGSRGGGGGTHAADRAALMPAGRGSRHPLPAGAGPSRPTPRRAPAP
jgi:hypothetical protein